MVCALWGASRISVLPRGPRLESEDRGEDDSSPRLQGRPSLFLHFILGRKTAMMNAVGELILRLFLLHSV